MEKEDFLACFDWQLGNLEGKVAVEEECGDGVFEVAAEFAPGAVGCALVFLLAAAQGGFDLADQALGATDGQVGENGEGSRTIEEQLVNSLGVGLQQARVDDGHAAHGAAQQTGRLLKG